MRVWYIDREQVVDAIWYEELNLDRKLLLLLLLG